MRKYWQKVIKRALRRALELARLESGERVAVFLIVVAVPALITWYLVGDHPGAVIRALATCGAASLAVWVIFIWNVLKLPSVMAKEDEAERIKLQEEIETENQRKQKVEQLAMYLHQAEDIKRRCAENLNITMNETQTWADNLNEYIKINFGNSYSIRLQSAAGTPSNILIGNMSEDKKTIWAYCNRIAYRLESFMSELSVTSAPKMIAHGL